MKLQNVCVYIRFCSVQITWLVCESVSQCRDLFIIRFFFMLSGISAVNKHFYSQNTHGEKLKFDLLAQTSTFIFFFFSFLHFFPQQKRIKKKSEYHHVSLSSDIYNLMYNKIPIITTVHPNISSVHIAVIYAQIFTLFYQQLKPY